MSKPVLCGLLRGFLLAVSIAATSTACGFRLAGTSNIPAQLEKIHLTTRQFSATQRERLEQRLKRAGISLVDTDDTDVLRLKVTLRIIPKRRLASSADSGKTVERIARSLVYLVSDASGNRLAGKALRQQLDFTLDEDNLLASNAERAEVVIDIELALYNQLLHQLKRI